ncbi:MAG: 2-succinyl-5-enolpyruvyl-6-hydroxy-3-cyclohexene-1-carboxylic-acid synthase [Candidatus Dadabacteria bacterium]|nr:MAG: 2-succinyl-5-enolpyruvyl-6-hydroxy-3-cyclohexene-1-carboxylic-acid synthase [Candidatus Dadabacteria bacterium]
MKRGINATWGYLIVEELVRLGAKNFWLSPGSRSAALALAAAEHAEINLHTHFDERGAAFAALGAARVSGLPSVLICTSGTAVANYLPAVIEASQSEVPLILLTADRPVEKRETGAHQTINQPGIFSRYVRFEFDVPAPSEEINPAFLLSLVDRAWAEALSDCRGPVQLNCQFREPLYDESAVNTGYLNGVSPWKRSAKPFTSYRQPALPVSKATLDFIRDRLESSRRPLFIAGHLNSAIAARAVSELSENFKIPLFADISSGVFSLSQDDRTAVFKRYDLYCALDEFQEKCSPDLIFHFGGPFLSKNLVSLIRNSGAACVRINNSPRLKDEFFLADEFIHCDIESFSAACSGINISVSAGYLEAVSSAESIADEVISAVLDQSGFNEWNAVRTLFQELPHGAFVQIANSMPVREADTLISLNRACNVYTSRGVSGIDGTVASAAGIACVVREPVALLTGDLAFLHDLNSLALLQQVDSPVLVVVLNNNGGAIFGTLPARESKHFEKLFIAPHAISSFEMACRQFKISHQLVRSHDDYLKGIRSWSVSGGVHLLEVVCDREETVSVRDELYRRVEQQFT